jgi:transcriptional regulator with XRE-family HTH domain
MQLLSAMEHPLKTYRLARDLSMDEMARRAQTTKSTLSRIEAGLIRPTHDLMLRLTKATENEVSIEALVHAAAESRAA